MKGNELAKRLEAATELDWRDVPLSRSISPRNCLGTIAALCILPAVAWAVTVGGNEDISDGVLSGTGDSVMRLTGTDGSRTNPFVFNWADADGDGSAGPNASTNLILGSFKLYDNSASDTKSFVLAMNGGSITGSTAAGVVAFDTGPGTGYKYPGNITVSNVGSIVIGRIVAARAGGAACAGGNVVIGSSNQPAGSVQIGGIVTVGDDYSGWQRSGDVTIYGSGRVHIATDSGVADITTYNVRYASGGRCGSIRISHDGELRAGSIDSGSAKAGGIGGSISLDGDYDNSGASGAATISSMYTANPGGQGRSAAVSVRGYTGLSVTGDIFTAVTAYGGGPVTIGNIGSAGVSIRDITTYDSHGSINYNGGGGSVTITNVTGPVSLRNVDTHASDTGSGYHAGGDLTISCWGDLTISGAINLNAAGGDVGDGNLSLTSDNGSISLASIDMSSLGWAKISFARYGTVTGTVASVATNYVSGGGSPLDPFATTQTELRVPAGKKVIYYPAVPGNAYLNGASYKVADLNGTAGEGGILTPYQPRGTVVIIH